MLRTKTVEVVLLQAGVRRADGKVFTEDSLRILADNERLFWDETKRALILRDTITFQDDPPVPYSPF